MPNVRGGTVRTFVDIDELWPAAEEYAREHGLPTASDVVRLALRRLLRPDG
jgi:Arc/MetJ family transcription regulator